MLFDRVRGNYANKYRIDGFVQRDQPDICSVAFIARAGMCEFYELNLQFRLRVSENG
jgi:hypothetical protein